MRLTLCLCLSLALLAAPALASTPWVHEDWQQRIPFQAVPSLIEGDGVHEDFSLLVSLNGTDHAAVFASARSDGADLLFATADGSAPLDREIVSYDPIGQTAEVWVRVPALSKSNNEFYLYFDNPLASLDPAPATAWSADYRAVYHFEDDPAGLQLRDSSPAGADVFLSGAHGWTSGDVAPGTIGQAWHLNGTTHHIATNSISAADSSYTIEAWLTHDVDNTDFFFQANPGFWHVSSHVPSRSKVDYAPGGGGFVSWLPNLDIPSAAPAHYMWQFDGVADTIYFYYNGVRQDVSTVYNLDPVYTGRPINPDNSEPVGVVGPMFYVTADFHSGTADEFRLREGRPTAERVLTEVRSASDPAGFLNYGPVESIGATSAPAITQLWLRSYPNPSSGPSSVRYAMPAEGHVRLSVYDVAGRRVSTLVDRRMPAGTWIARWDGRSGSGRAVAAGVYFLRLETPQGQRSAKITLVR